MQLRQTNPVAVGAARRRSGSRPDTGSATRPALCAGDGSPDPLGDLFETEFVSMLAAVPGLRPIAVFEEKRADILISEPAFDGPWNGGIRSWRTGHHQVNGMCCKDA